MIDFVWQNKIGETIMNQELIGRLIEILRELFQRDEATLYRDYVLELENGLRRSIDVLVTTKSGLYAFEIKSFLPLVDYSNSYMMIDGLVNQAFKDYRESLYYFVIYDDIEQPQYFDFKRQQPSDELFVTVDGIGGINLLFSSDFNNIQSLKSKIGQTQSLDLTRLGFLSWNRQAKKQHSVFINYRRKDSAWAAGRIADYLRTIYEDDEIFLDTRSIDLGDDFDETITKRIKASNILLVIIGEKWLNIDDPVSGIRRLDMDDDFVRKEIITAIQNKLIIIPVLIDDTGMPWGVHLPYEIKSLSKRNAARVRADHFINDMKPLVTKLDAQKVKRKP